MTKKQKRILIMGGITITIIGTLVIYDNINIHDRINKLEKDNIRIKELAKASLKRELKRNNAEIRKIESSLPSLNDNANINKFDRIPKKLARLEELKIDNEEIRETLGTLD